MERRPGFRSFVRVLPLVFLIVATARADPDRWLHAQSPHFEVLSAASERKSRELVEQLEAFRAAFQRLFPGIPLYDKRTTIVIFATDSDFQPYKPLFRGRPIELAGVFAGGDDESVMALAAGRDVAPALHTIQHEYVHVLLHGSGLRLPLWLDEGHAELLATMRLTRRGMVMGEHSAGHRAVLQRMRRMPLEQLFAVTLGSPTYHEDGPQRMLFYAQSWALAHLWRCGMIDGRTLETEYDNFMQRLLAGEPAVQAMEAAFGMTTDEMEVALHEYLRNGTFLLRTVPPSEAADASPVRFEPATGLQSDVALLNLQMRLRPRGDELLLLQEIADRHPEAPRPREVLGALALRSGSEELALSYYREAVQAGSTQPYIYTFLARDELHNFLTAAQAPMRLGERQTANLNAWLDRASALAPDWYEPLDWLALTVAFSPVLTQDAANRIQAAHRRFPARPRLMAGLALIAERTEQHDIALHLAEALLAHPAVRRVPRHAALAASPGSVGAHGGLADEDYSDVRYLARGLQQRIVGRSPARTSQDAAGAP